MPDTASPHYLSLLNQLMGIQSSIGPSHFWRRHFTCFTNTQDTSYITENGRKKNKQVQTWVSPKHKKGEVWALFLDFCASVAIMGVYASEIPTQLLGTLIHPLALANPASGSTSPNPPSVAASL